MGAAWALEVMDSAPYITIGMTDKDGRPYAIPLSLARVGDHTFYFHCAPEGRKLVILRNNPQVCLTAVSKCKYNPQNEAFRLFRTNRSFFQNETYL